MDQCDREFLVTPALGLYCELLAQEKLNLLTQDKKEVLDFFKANKHQVFPPTFAYSTPNGPETRELFGEILTVLEELNQNESGDEGIMASAVKMARKASQKDSSITDRFIGALPGSDEKPSSSVDRSSTGSYEDFQKFLKGPEADKPEQSSSVEMGTPHVDTATLVTEAEEHSGSDSSGKEKPTNGASNGEAPQAPSGDAGNSMV